MEPISGALGCNARRTNVYMEPTENVPLIDLFQEPVPLIEPFQEPHVLWLFYYRILK